MEKLQPGYGLNHEGYIVSDVSLDNISELYYESIEESIKELKILFPKKLHSIYLYGSVARGDATPVKSELDLLILFKDKLLKDEQTELENLQQRLSKKYIKIIREVGIATAEYDYVMDPDNYYEQAFIKEICTCLYGEDIGVHFGPYKLIAEIPISFNGDIEMSLKRNIDKLRNADTETFKVFTQNFSKKLIRTYYSMVMVRSQIWTTRLDEQAIVVERYLKDKEKVVERLLQWIESPPDDYETVHVLFISEGQWLVLNFERETKITQED